MLVLMWRAGANRYAIESSSVSEVVPCVNVEIVAGAPDWISGVFAHRGAATPLVDLTRLLSGEPCPRRWSSRIMLVRPDAEGVPEQLGLLAERVTTAEIETLERAGTGGPSSVERLGPILMDEEGMFQLVDVGRLLCPDRLSALHLSISEGAS